MADNNAEVEEKTIDYLGVLVSHWKLLLLGTLVCAIAAAGISLLMPNVYEASSMLLVAPPQFKTTLNPASLPAQTYKRMLTSKGLLSGVLEKIKEKYPKEFANVKVEDLSSRSRVEVEVARQENAEMESYLLVLYMQDVNPEYAKELTDIWTSEFMALERQLQMMRTGETERFVTTQFEEAREKLKQAEDAVTEFKNSAQTEILNQKSEIYTNQARTLFSQLEDYRQQLAVEKQNLLSVQERISAVEIDGKWLGEITKEKVSLSGLNETQKGIANELLKIARSYENTSERLSALARSVDVETLRQRLASYRSMLIEKDPRLEKAQQRCKSLEAALSKLSEQLDKMEKLITLKSSIPEEILWEKLLGNPSEKQVKKLSEMQMSSEILSPEYVQLANHIINLEEELEIAKSEGTHIKEKIPQLEEEVRILESEFQKQLKQHSDLHIYHSELQDAYETHYRNYLYWLDERNTAKIRIADLNHYVELFEERYVECVKNMNEYDSELSRKNDQLEQLRRKVEVATHAYELFKNKVEEARIVTSQDKGNISQVSAAVKPGKKVAPQRSLITIVAAIIGFLVLSFFVVLRTYQKHA